jgi:hypothetical protein
MVPGTKMKLLWGILSVLLLGSLSGNAKAAEQDVFSTWDVLEADKCASIWLIKRFIAPNAQIRFYPKGDTITDGIAFDTPDADFRRYHSKSTFETMQQHYQITDNEVLYIGRIIHDIEINTWEKKLMPETDQVMRELQPFILQKSPARWVGECSAYFGQLFEKLKLGPK